MSSSIVTTPPIKVTDIKTQSRLPEKYGKFIQFAYYMMDNIIGLDDLPEDEERKMMRESFLEKIKLFESVEDQQAMVQGFLDNSKEIKKTIRKTISDRKKAIAKELTKANKPVRQPRAKKVNSDGTDVVKKPRKKATKEINNVQDELLNDLVSLARDEKPVDSIVVENKESNE